jgi:hypothetical protein
MVAQKYLPWFLLALPRSFPAPFAEPDAARLLEWARNNRNNKTGGRQRFIGTILNHCDRPTQLICWCKIAITLNDPGWQPPNLNE